MCSDAGERSRFGKASNSADSVSLQGDRTSRDRKNSLSSVLCGPQCSGTKPITYPGLKVSLSLWWLCLMFVIQPTEISFFFLSFINQVKSQQCLLTIRHKYCSRQQPGEVPHRKYRAHWLNFWPWVKPELDPRLLPAQLHEVDVETEFLKASDASCDVACLMYDTSDPHSFNYCASIYKVSP